LLAVYLLNGRTIGAGDTVPNTLLAAGIADGQGLVLDRYRPMVAPGTAIPYWATERSGRLVSSALTDAHYDPKTRSLDLRFVTARRYRYFNVPPEIYEGLLSADSKGVFFNANIRDKYNYRELPS